MPIEIENSLGVNVVHPPGEFLFEPFSTTVSNLSSSPAGNTLTAFIGSWEGGGEGRLATVYPDNKTWDRTAPTSAGTYTADVWGNYCNPSVSGTSCSPQIDETNYNNNH